VSKEPDAERLGRGLVEAIARAVETKVHLKLALDALHTAMAVTPFDLGHVTVMGDLARGVAAQLAEHEELVNEFAKGITVANAERGVVEND
jgi:hypothetical protein